MMDQSAIVDALSQATREVFSTMLGLDVTSGEPYTEINAPGQSGGMVAVIGLAGIWIGTASLCCTAAMGCRMSSQMLGTKLTEVNEEVLDAVSEITNMIMGGFKTRVEKHLGPLGLSIPTVIYGMSFSARSSCKERWIVVPFLCADDTLHIKVYLTPNRGLPRPIGRLLDAV